uniref:(northern house mosquito) hypothetical protein n=1 Tax=Culex pipiens TaxID=7175 RepID=A0A8D8FW78_CULPI
MFRSSFACIVIGGGGLGWVEPATAAYGGRGLRRSSSVPKALTTVKANSPQIRVAPRVFFIVTRSVGLWPSVGHYRDFINFPLVFHRPKSSRHGLLSEKTQLPPTGLRTETS